MIPLLASTTAFMLAALEHGPDRQRLQREIRTRLFRSLSGLFEPTPICRSLATLHALASSRRHDKPLRPHPISGAALVERVLLTISSSTISRGPPISNRAFERSRQYRAPDPGQCHSRRQSSTYRVALTAARSTLPPRGDYCRSAAALRGGLSIRGVGKTAPWVVALYEAVVALERRRRTPAAASPTTSDRRRNAASTVHLDFDVRPPRIARCEASGTTTSAAALRPVRPRSHFRAVFVRTLLAPSRGAHIAVPSRYRPPRCSWTHGCRSRIYLLDGKIGTVEVLPGADHAASNAVR